MPSNTWKMQDAKARLSELVRRAREGEPQHVTMHGKQAVVVFDPSRYELTPKSERPLTMRGFVEESKKYRGLAEDIDFEQPVPMHIDPRNSVFDEDEK
jgi:prevent-host-death family protein